MSLPAIQLPSICRSSSFWMVAFLIWGIVLWYLSDRPLPDLDGLEIPGIDKVLHFGYFFGGAGLLSAAFFLRAPSDPNWSTLALFVILIVSAVGMLDEWHQSWTPARSGNDAGDWLADTYGALAGTLVFRRLHRVLT